MLLSVREHRSWNKARTGARAGKLRASSTWSAESLMGREPSVVRKFRAKVVSDILTIDATICRGAVVEGLRALR